MLIRGISGPGWRRRPKTELVMTKRVWFQGVQVAMGLMAGVLLAPVPALAQISRVSSVDSRHAIGVNLGGFFLKGEDSRVNEDVLLADLDSLAFQIKDFNGGSFAGEWLIGLGQYLEAGVGAGFYQRTVPSVYRSVVNDNGAEIEQDLKLRVVPITATIRFLPIGRGSVEPYVGAGIGAFNWRYSETGEFVDFEDGSAIFRGRYIAKGTAVGPVILAGLRAPFGDIWDIGGEIRWQKAEGDTKASETGLLGDRIDLGGWNAGVTLHIRF